jgi:hypothetical protein
MKSGKRGKQTYNRTEAQLARSLDKLAAFQDWSADILPRLRKMLANPDVTPEDILEFSKAYAVAKVATIAFTDDDNARALSAAKDLLDRSLGKAKERQEVEHKFGKLKEEELDALIESRLAEASTADDADERTDH